VIDFIFLAESNSFSRSSIGLPMEAWAIILPLLGTTMETTWLLNASFK